MARFFAFAVDIHGTALARCDSVAVDEEAAKQEASAHLDQRPVIEIWSDDHRRVARLTASSIGRL